MNALTPIAVLTVIAASIITCAGSAAVAADLSGTYSGNQIKLEMKPAGGEKYTGTIYFNGLQFAAQIVDVGAGCVGTFDAQGQQFRFELRPSAGASGGFTLVTDGVEYPLTRDAGSAPAAPANPLTRAPDAPRPANADPAAPPASAPAAPSTPGAKDPLAYKVKQLPGGSIAQFDDWQYQSVPAPENMLIVDGFPNGHQKDFVLRTAVATPNSQDLANLFTVGPQLTQQLLSMLSPTFRRSGEQKQTKVGGDDAMTEEYEGNVQGQTYKVRVLYVRREDVGMAVLGIGTDAGFKDYGRAIEIVAQSITFKQSPLEPELIGTWTFEASSRAEGVHLSDTVVVSSSRSITIYPNSTFTDSNSGTATGPGMTGIQQGGSRGKLVKRGNMLTFHYDDGHTWGTEYSVGGGGLKLNGQLFIKQ